MQIGDRLGDRPGPTGTRMTLTDTRIALNGVDYEPHEIPVVYFGRKKRLAYVHNPKAACTSALNFLFFANHGYAYLKPGLIHFSKFAFVRLGPQFDPAVINAFNELAPETFSIVREPLQRFISGFITKIVSHEDANYSDLRDLVTSIHDVDLSADADPAQTCLAFARLIDSQHDRKQIDRHFRPQYLNLGLDGTFRPDTILHLEDIESVSAYLSRWMDPAKAQALLARKHGAEPGYAKDKFMSDELVKLVRKIYARDYELFYA